MSDDDLIRRGDALAAIFEAINKVAHAHEFSPLQIQMAKRRYEKAIAAVPAVNDDRIEALEQRLDATKDKAEAAILDLMSKLGKAAKAVELLKEARQDLEEYVTHEWPKDEHPVYERKWHRDMELCRRIDAVLAEIEGGKDG